MMTPRLRAVCDLRIADVRERAGRHEYDGLVQDLSPDGVAIRLSGLGGPCEDDPVEEAHLSAFEAAARVVFGQVQMHRWNPRVHLENLDLGVYDRPYAPAAVRRSARSRHTAAWPEAVAAALASLDAVPAPVAAALLPATRGLGSQLDPEADGADRARAALGRLVAHLEAAEATGPREVAIGDERLAALLGAGESLRVDLGRLAEQATCEQRRLEILLRDACAELLPGSTVEQAVAAVLADHPDAEGVLAEAHVLTERAIAFTRERGLVADLDGECRVTPAPVSRRWATAMLDWAAPGEPEGPSWFRITPPEPRWPLPAQEQWLQAYSRATLPVTTVHEVAPGHFAHGRALRRLDSDIRRALQSPAFVEGWAHYAEELMLEEGFGGGDARFAAGVALKGLLRTTRLLVAIGIHTDTMPRDEAVHRFETDAYLRPVVARTETARATFDPTYGRYTWGKLLLRTLRDRMKKESGPRWSLSRFHAAVLSLGAPPLGLLARVITPEALDEPTQPRQRPSPAADLDALVALPGAVAQGFTADGATLLAVSDATGQPQAWAVPVPAPGGACVVTHGHERVRAVTASPVDASLLIVAVDEGGNERTQLHTVRLGGGSAVPLAVHQDAIHRQGPVDPSGAWLYFCSNTRNGVDFDLFRVPLPVGDVERCCQLEGSCTPIDVSADGTLVLVVREHSTMHSEVLVVDVRRGAVAAALGSDGPRTERHLDASFDDAGRILVRSDRDSDWLGVWQVDLDTWNWRPVARWAADVDRLAVAGRRGALVVNDGGYSRLHLFDPVDGTIGAPLAVPAGVISDLRWATSGRRLAFTLTAPDRPSELWMQEDGRCVRLRGDHGADAVDTAVAPQRSACSTPDGTPVPLLVYRPPGVARPPVVVSVHGGPASQERPEFSPLYQHLVARGLAIVAPNVRGSTGYGRRFAELDDRERRGEAIADLAAVRDWLDVQPDLDGSRVAIMGRSYGGYLVLSALTCYPDRFLAGVDIVGMANLVTFLERTSSHRRAHREVEYGRLDVDRELLRRLSPLGRVGRITAPLLVLHGQNDPRVPVSEARSIVSALRQRGRSADLIVFGDEGHEFNRRENVVKAHRATAGFLVDHLLA